MFLNTYQQMISLPNGFGLPWREREWVSINLEWFLIFFLKMKKFILWIISIISYSYYEWLYYNHWFIENREIVTSALPHQLVLLHWHFTYNYGKFFTHIHYGKFSFGDWYFLSENSLLLYFERGALGDIGAWGDFQPCELRPVTLTFLLHYLLKNTQL